MGRHGHWADCELDASGALKPQESSSRKEGRQGNIMFWFPPPLFFFFRQIRGQDRTGIWLLLPLELLRTFYPRNGFILYPNAVDNAIRQSYPDAFLCPFAVYLLGGNTAVFTKGCTSSSLQWPFV